MSDPTRVVVAGDWHGSVQWATAVIDLLPELLPEESPRIMVHVGDFGIWPGRGGEQFLREVTAALDRVDGQLWFVDGNHDDHQRLDYNARTLRTVMSGDLPDNEVWVPYGAHIRHLPRGYRWTWHDRAWAAAGGAVSVDRAFRQAGRDWWPEEEISEADHARIVDGGHVDVLVCHDAPTSVPMTFGLWPSGWDVADKTRADAHRDRLQSIVDDVAPSLLVHGHYHRWHDLTVEQGYGDLRVLGLDMDGALTGNFVILNVETMQLETPTVVAAEEAP